MKPALLIFGIALWLGYFMVKPWAAGACAVFLAIFGALIHNELRHRHAPPSIHVHIHDGAVDLAHELDRMEKAGGISVIGGARRGPERVR